MSELEQVIVDIEWRGQPKREIRSGTRYTTLIKALILEINPKAQFSFDDTDLTVPRILLSPDEDRWQFALDCAAAIAMSLGADGDLYWLRRIHTLPRWPELGSPPKGIA